MQHRASRVGVYDPWKPGHTPICGPLRDGLAITVTSAKTVDEARVFYQEALAKAGWTAEPQGRGASVPNMPVARVAFSKGEVTYSAMITAVPDGGVRIDIRVMLS